MKVAYIAGPFRAKNGRTVQQNIEAAREVAIKYWKKGFAVLCPHLNSFLMDGVVPDDVFLSAGLNMMRRCDVVVAMVNWAESDGATREIELADDLEMKVIYDDGVFEPLTDCNKDCNK
jgi:nucleoside 2-deoxyribosyltransferase